MSIKDSHVWSPHQSVTADRLNDTLHSNATRIAKRSWFQLESSSDFSVTSGMLGAWTPLLPSTPKYSWKKTGPDDFNLTPSGVMFSNHQLWSFTFWFTASSSSQPGVLHIGLMCEPAYGDDYYIAGQTYLANRQGTSRSTYVIIEGVAPVWKNSIVYPVFLFSYGYSSPGHPSSIRNTSASYGFSGYCITDTNHNNMEMS